jgi:hypothetical protein
MEYRLTSSDILRMWEAGLARRPLDRALTMLWAAGVPGDLSNLPLAERDRELLGIRTATFGRRLDVRASCPECGADLEMAFDTGTLAAAIPDVTAEQISLDGETVTLRPLASADVAAISAVPDADRPAVLRARLTGRDDVPDTLRPSLDARIEAREEDAELTARLTCTACDAVWREALDITILLWTEIEAVALRLLGEVAEIAAALGWSESDILALSEPRRQVYLALARRG